MQYAWLPMGHNRTLQSYLPEKLGGKTNTFWPSLLHMSLILFYYPLIANYSLASTCIFMRWTPETALILGLDLW